MDTKVCSKCGVERALCEFSKNKNTKDGLQTTCKSCAKAYREKNKERINKRGRVRYATKRTKLLKDKQLYYQENKQRIKAYEKANKTKIAARMKKYRKENREKIATYQRAYERKRKSIDPAYRLRKNVSSAVSAACKKQGNTKGGATFLALPYSPHDLVEHLERQFDDKMNWDNYGSYWDVDHIYPQSLLPYDSLDHPNFQKCWALDNLQPLEKMENIKKSNKVL